MMLFKKYFFGFFIFSILFLAIYFRLYMLGYSDFQQDEVRALGFMFDDKPFIKFLLTPSIGPGEFVVARFFSLIKPPFVDMHMWLRFPFALAGIFSVFLLFFIISKFFSFRLYSIGFLLFCMSGYMIAFSRMLQYQVFLILFLLAGLYFLFKYNQDENKLNLMYAGFCSCFALLFHYDSILITFSFFVFLLIKSIISKKYKPLLYFIFPILISSIFYVPYLLTGNFWQKVFPYILNRSLISRESIDPLFFSIKLFLIYHPIETLLAVVIGGTLFLYSKDGRLGAALILSLILRYINYNYNIWLIVLSTVIFLFFIIKNILYAISQKDISNLFLLELWFYFTFLFYGIIFKEPFTHIYTFLIPLYLLASRQLELLPFKNFVLIFLFIGSVSFNYQLFVNHDAYYPWKNSNYIYGRMWRESEELRYDIGKDLGFGFGLPYNRSWRETQRYFIENNISYGTKYFSNEKDRTARFYLNDFEKTDEPKMADILVCIDHPYSLRTCPPTTVNLLIEFENSHIFAKDATINQ